MSITTLSDYGSIFQSKLMKFLIEDKMFFFKLHPVLRPEYFSDKKYRDLLKVIIKHFETYSDLPTYDVLSIYANKIVDIDRKDAMIRLINEVKIEDGNPEFFLDEALKFCKRNEIKETLIDSVDFLQNEDYEKIEDRLMSLMKKINIDISGHNYWENFDARSAMTRFNIIPTGWDPIDAITNGGLGAGELGVIAGGPGFGKCTSRNTKIDIEIEKIIIEDDNGMVNEYYPWENIKLPNGNIKLAKDIVDEDFSL